MTTRARSLSCTPARPSLLRRILDALVVARQRKRLGTLDPHLLQDIGITPEDARTESTRPLWDVPRHWRQ
jgi:uncharacterized protein YjiS (DUF1127 family)